MMQPRRAPLSPELILRLQTTVGNRAVQRLMENRYRIEESEPVEAAWWRWRFWLIAAAGVLGAITGVILWFGFHMHAAAITASLVAAAIALCIAGWIRFGLVRSRKASMD